MAAALLLLPTNRAFVEVRRERQALRPTLRAAEPAMRLPPVGRPTAAAKQRQDSPDCDHDVVTAFGALDAEIRLAHQLHEIVKRPGHSWNINGTRRESLVRQSDRIDIEKVERCARTRDNDLLRDEPSGGLRIRNVEPPAASAVYIEREAMPRGDETSIEAMMGRARHRQFINDSVSNVVRSCGDVWPFP